MKKWIFFLLAILVLALGFSTKESFHTDDLADYPWPPIVSKEEPWFSPLVPYQWPSSTLPAAKPIDL